MTKNQSIESVISLAAVNTKVSNDSILYVVADKTSYVVISVTGSKNPRLISVGDYEHAYGVFSSTSLN